MHVLHFVPSCGSLLDVFISLEHLVCCESTLQEVALVNSSSRRKHEPKGMAFRFFMIGFSISNYPSRSLLGFGLESFHFFVAKSFDN